MKQTGVMLEPSSHQNEPMIEKIVCTETNYSVTVRFQNFHSLNRGSAPLVFHKLQRYLPTGKNIQLNLEGIESIDAQGLALLLQLNRKLRSRHADLVLTNPSAAMQKIFWITEINRLITIKKST